MWLIYNEASPDTQTMMGIITVIAVAILIFSNLFFWIKEKNKS
jgi:hypothetical protein